MNRSDRPEAHRGGAIMALDGKPLHAASFIVTVYGDVVEPRGGVAWIGSLIDVCGRVGISATLVRTAVSRLVSAGQLVGEKCGKRSFYRLTPAAKIEFASAADLLFSPVTERSWRFLYLSGPDAEENARHCLRNGYRRVGPALLVGCRPLPPAIEGQVTVFSAAVERGEAFLKAFAEDYLDLPPLAEAYRRFIGRYSGPGLEPLLALDAVARRLLLVHDFRYVVLRDPHFPAEALAPDWPGEAARRLFSSLYRAWSAEADRMIGQTFSDKDGPLPAHTAVTARREALLAQV